MELGDKQKKDLQKLLNSKMVKDAHAFIRLIGGLTRYRILVLLHHHAAGLTVTDLACTLEASPSQISHQISILKAHGLINGRPKGRTVIYCVEAKKVKPFLQ